MSKRLDFTQPLSEEEVAYAEQFPGLHGQTLEANAAQFAGTQEETLDGSPSGDEDVPYTEWTLAELQTEVDDRNQQPGRTVKLKRTGSKQDLVKVLEDDDNAVSK